MQTIKTGIVVALLIAVCYGAFVALNAPEADIPEELAQWANSPEFNDLVDIEMPGFGNQPTSPSDLTAASSSPSKANKQPAPKAQGFGVSGSDRSGASLPSMPTFDADLIAETPSVPSFPGSLPSPSAASNNGALANNAPSTGGMNLPLPDSKLLPDGFNSKPFSGEQTDGPSIPFGVPPVSSDSATAGQLVSADRGKNPADSTTAMTLPLLGESTNGSAGEKTAAKQREVPTMPFAIAREQALAKAEAGKLKDALQMLTPYYNSPDMDHVEHTDLVDILDALTREVIYSRRHLLQPAHIVKAGDTLASLASQYSISPELLAAINATDVNSTLVTGSELKVISGPFHASISLMRGELTVFLDDLYAGRFPIALAKENPASVGVFEVVDRRKDRTYYGPQGVVIQANQPENPYGGYWISLGGNLAIHGSPELARSELKDAGCISLAPLDARDVYNILTKHSQISIER